ncbi:hypothetical protein [Marinospirillum alkaliphilum]|uniref:Uncharacterized protein n=1 Tax=Marinospirillum alkaliphilum DSM 21637 TaxID=1122209 RepID=A0A1K1W2Z8_9GAMM|nr:hypothetical protein [Marinospirillum alkaliphilum]SFX31809.1 hypothetical protein SAMN02745752_01254 [Marinospirillum alkaliphilum DSM 21637]
MKMLNRSAISVRLTQPFVDWINSLDASGEEQVSLEDVNQEATTYLVPELEDEDSLETLLDERYLDILENELLSWEEDTRLWPDQLDRALFDAFIEVEPSFMVFDLDDQAPLLAQVVDEIEDLGDDN